MRADHPILHRQRRESTRCAALSSVPTLTWSACTPTARTRSAATPPSSAACPRPTGITATDDIDALVALEADCVVYTSQAETRPHGGASTRSAASSRPAPMSSVPPSCGWCARARRRVAARAAGSCLRRKADSTLYVNGIDPGFSGDMLVYAALSLAARATAVTVQEIFDYGTYDDAEFTGVSFGFGTRPDHTPILFQPGRAGVDVGCARCAVSPSSSASSLDEVRERHEKWVAPEAIDCTMMRVEPGHVAAVEFGVEGSSTAGRSSRWSTSTGSPRPPPRTGRIRPTGIPACTGSIVERQPRHRDQRPRRHFGHRPQPGRRHRDRRPGGQRHRGGVPGADRHPGRS